MKSAKYGSPMAQKRRSRVKQLRNYYFDINKYYSIRGVLGFWGSGWVEHDPAEIRNLSQACLEEVAAAVGVERIAAIGITNQRETICFWDRTTGEPLARAIVWQDRRTADYCAGLKAADPGLEAKVQAKTGLLLDPYFSGTKFRWALDNWPMLMPSIQKIRMVNSGTEATMTAIRLARGFTQKNKIIKFNGCYHGHNDSLFGEIRIGCFDPGSAMDTRDSSQYYRAHFNRTL